MFGGVGKGWAKYGKIQHYISKEAKKLTEASTHGSVSSPYQYWYYIQLKEYHTNTLVRLNDCTTDYNTTPGPEMAIVQAKRCAANAQLWWSGDQKRKCKTRAPLHSSWQQRKKKLDNHYTQTIHHVATTAVLTIPRTYDYARRMYQNITYII